jgi:hypothetical protein
MKTNDKKRIPMVALRPLANIIARCTSPSQVNSVIKEFGFKEKIKNPIDSEAMLLIVFETFSKENKNNEIKIIIETLLSLYSSLVDEKQNNIFHKQINEILQKGYFCVGYNTLSKKYILTPFEEPIKRISMKVGGVKNEDLFNTKKYKERILPNTQKNKYFTKDGNDFKYEGKLIEKISKNTDYYIIFNSLYTLLPDGGSIKYTDLIKKISEYIPKTKRLKDPISFLQRNLSDRNNGFLHYAEIPNLISGGKRLIKTIRGYGFEFNNIKGN